MTVKSVIDVEVNDAAFATFKALFDKYQAQAKESGVVWAQTNTEIKAVAGNFGDMVAAMMAQATLQDALDKKAKAENTRRKAEEERQGRFWKQLKTDTATVGGNILKATTALAKWGGLTATIGGLIGAGGLFGLDKLGLAVGQNRRSSLGLGLGIGAQQAFGNDFGRFVDPTGFLGGVSESLHDVTKRWQLSAAGVRGTTIASGDTGEVSLELLKSAKALVDKTPANQLAQLSQSRGLGQFFSLQDLVRLKATKPEELVAQEAAYRQDSKSFGLNDDVARRMQDFATQLDRAKLKIEAAFVKGIDPLIPSLGKLSDAVAGAVTTFLTSIKPADVKAIGDGITDFAKYIGSPKFKSDISDLAADIGTLAKTVADALHKLGSHSVKDAAFGAAAGFALGGPGGALVGGLVGGSVGSLRDGGAGFHEEKGFFGTRLVPNVVAGSGSDPNRPSHWYDPGSWLNGSGGRPNDTNPGNIRPVGGNGYNAYSTPEDGIKAVGSQLLRYEYGKKWGHLDTIAKIIATYAPAKDHNDVGAYVRDVVGRTGFGANQHLELSDSNVLAKIISAILQHEKGKRNAKYTPEAVIKIINNTGGNAVVAANQAGK